MPIYHEKVPPPPKNNVVHKPSSCHLVHNATLYKGGGGSCWKSKIVYELISTIVAINLSVDKSKWQI